MVTFSSCLIWQIINFILPPNKYGCVYAWTTLGSGPAIDLPISIEDADFGKKNHLSDEANFNLCGYVNKQNYRIWGTENAHVCIEKPKHPKGVTVWCGFWSRGIIGPLFFENEQGAPVTINGDRYRAMMNEKLKRRILATFGFNRTALRATQPKLHSMICALVLKIVLSAAELMSLGHPGAAIWHQWTTICGDSSKISVTPTSQRQLTL